MSEESNRPSRLTTWMDEEVASYRQHYALDVEGEREYREALAGTFRGAFLALEDAADNLRQPFRWWAHRKLRKAQEDFDAARDRSLAEWFRRHW